MDTSLSEHGIKYVRGLDSIRYLFVEMYAKITPGSYPFVGSTHPPGMFLITGAIYGFGAKVLPFLSKPAACGLMVALINTSAIIIIGLIAKEMFSEKIARLTCVMILCLPSVDLHYIAVIDGVASVFIGLGALFLIYSLNAISNAHMRAHIIYGFFAGLSLTLAAQFSFGHAFPIFALLVAFFISANNIPSPRLRLLQFISALAVVPLCYFLFEYLISDGKVFYLAMALERSRTVRNGLISRPYPLSQFANLIVMSVMGGMIIFPGVMLSLTKSFSTLKKYIKKQPVRYLGKSAIRDYMLLAVSIMVLLLSLQSTVRLEVERTWHWLFLPVWTLMGFLFYGLQLFSRRLFPPGRRWENWSLLLFFLSQLVVTVSLAMSVQDYY